MQVVISPFFSWIFPHTGTFPGTKSPEVNKIKMQENLAESLEQEFHAQVGAG